MASPAHAAFRSRIHQCRQAYLNSTYRLASRLSRSCFKLGFVLVAFAFLHANAPVSAQDPPPEAFNLFREAATLQNANEFDLAIEVWETFLERFPETDLTIRATHYVGLCHVQSGNFEKARDYFTAVVEATGDDDPFEEFEATLLNLGWCHFNLAESAEQPDESYASAAITFRRLIDEFDPGKFVDQACYFLGESLYLSGNVEASLAPYQRVVDDFPESSLRDTSMYALGVGLEELGRNEEALAIYATYLNDYPTAGVAAEVSMRTAEIQLQQGLELERVNGVGDDASLRLFATAEARFQALSQSDSFDQRDLATFKLAFCLFKRDSLEASAETYASVSRDFPNSSYANDAALSAGRTYFRSRQYDDALTWLGNVAKDSGEAALEAAHWTCRIHLLNDRPEQAYAVANGRLENAIETSQYTILLMMDRADAAYEIPDRKATAYDLYLEVADTYPGNPQAGQALYYAAFAAFEAQQYDNAIAQAAKYQADYSSGTLLKDVLSVQGEAQLQLGDFAAAGESFEQLVSISEPGADQQTWTVRRALCYTLTSDDEQAAAYLIPKLADFSESASVAEANFILASISFRAEEFELAEERSTRSLEADAQWRQADETTLLLARAKFRNEKVTEAISLVSSFEDSFPNSTRKPEAKYRLGEFAYAAADYDVAKQAYESVLATNNEDFKPFATDGLAWTQFKQRDYASAATSFGTLLDSFPEHSLVAQAHYGRAVCRNLTGNYGEAIEDLERYLTMVSDDTALANATFEIGVSQVGLNEMEAAATSFAKVLDDYPEFDRREQALYELAWCHLDLGQAEQAQPAFETLVREYESGANFAEANFHLGEFAYDREEYAEAEDYYQTSIDGDANDSITENAIYKLGWTKFHRDDFDGAFVEFSRQTESYADGNLYIDGKFMIAECCYRSEQFDKALAQYRAVWPSLRDQADQANSTYVASTLLHGAQSAIQADDFETAREYGERFIEKFASAQEVPEAFLQVGRAYAGLEQTDQAIENLENAALQSSDHVGAQARFFIGELYFEQRDYEEAQKQFRRVMLGYGGANATPRVKLYQAMSAFEAGRCADVQIRDATGEQRQELIESAKGFYQQVVEDFGDNPYQAAARERITALSSQ